MGLKTVAKNIFHPITSHRERIAEALQRHKVEVQSRMLPAPEGWVAVKSRFENNVRVFRTEDQRELALDPYWRHPAGLDCPERGSYFGMLYPTSRGIEVKVGESID